MLFFKAINAHQQAQQSGLESAIIDDVPMEEIIEGTVGALHQLARDHHNGAVIRDLKCIPVLVQLLYMPWDSIQRVSCGCLSELAKDRINLELIDNEHITDKLTELLKSNDHAISTYAAAVLLCLSEYKPNSAQGHQSADQLQNWNGSNINYAMNADPNSIYASSIARNNNIGSNDQYVSYNTIEPYEMEEIQNPPHYSQMGQLTDIPILPPNQQQQLNKPPPQHLHQTQSPATWFDTDL